MIKSLAKYLLRRLGYEVSRPQTATVGFNASCLSRICQPETVIDVGVGYGTFPLYEAFPKARFVLFEPLREYEAAINEIMAHYDCEVFFQAVGDEFGTKAINVETSDLEKSSFMERTQLTATGNRTDKRRVTVSTLDGILAGGSGLRQPILLKVDTEGHDLKVLEGARSLLQKTETVIVEATLAKRFKDGYEFEDLILFMKENGFYILTFLNMTFAPGEITPRFADVVFKRRPPRRAIQARKSPETDLS